MSCYLFTYMHCAVMIIGVSIILRVTAEYKQQNWLLLSSVFYLSQWCKKLLTNVGKRFNLKNCMTHIVETKFDLKNLTYIVVRG